MDNNNLETTKEIAQIILGSVANDASKLSNTTILLGPVRFVINKLISLCLPPKIGFGVRCFQFFANLAFTV